MGDDTFDDDDFDDLPISDDEELIEDIEDEEETNEEDIVEIIEDGINTPIIKSKLPTIEEDFDDVEDYDLDEEDDSTGDELKEDFEIIEDGNLKVTEKRVTFNILTKYEKNFLLGFRIQQIINGSCILIDIDKIDNKTPYGIALEELNKKVIPFKIKRTLPNGNVEIWDLDELMVI